MLPSPKSCSLWLCRQQKQSISCPRLRLPYVKCFCRAVYGAPSAETELWGAGWHCLLVDRVLVLPSLCLNTMSTCGLYVQSLFRLLSLQDPYLCRSSLSWLPGFPTMQILVIPSSHVCVDARKEKDSRTQALNHRKQQYSLSPTPVLNYSKEEGLQVTPAYSLQYLFPSLLMFAVISITSRNTMSCGSYWRHMVAVSKDEVTFPSSHSSRTEFSFHLHHCVTLGKWHMIWAFLVSRL